MAGGAPGRFDASGGRGLDGRSAGKGGSAVGGLWQVEVIERVAFWFARVQGLCNGASRSGSCERHAEMRASAD